jgi:hypothetical protein
VTLAAAAAAGCLVRIEHCTDPAAAFREAHAEADHIIGHGEKAKQVNVLVFDPDDEKLVRVSVPMWLAKKAYHIAEGDDDPGTDTSGDAGERAARELRHRIPLAELEKAGPGILVEVEEDEGEQVLVWLR